jgi:hypothetical protein
MQILPDSAVSATYLSENVSGLSTFNEADFSTARQCAFWLNQASEQIRYVTRSTQCWAQRSSVWILFGSCSHNRPWCRQLACIGSSSCLDGNGDPVFFCSFLSP